MNANKAQGKKEPVAQQNQLDLLVFRRRLYSTYWKFSRGKEC
jgi:hypothetical protein